MGSRPTSSSGAGSSSGAKTEKLFALSTAQVTLEVELGLRSDGAAGVVFKPLSAGEFVRAENELEELLTVAARDSGSKIERKEDELGFNWLVVRDNDVRGPRHDRAPDRHRSCRRAASATGCSPPSSASRATGTPST